MPARAATVASLLLALSRPAAAEEPPIPGKGFWEITRTVTEAGGSGAPKRLSRNGCMDLAADLRSQRATLEKAGCAFGPTTRRGDAWAFESTCRMAGMVSRSRNVTIVKADGYESTVESETESGGKTVRTTEKVVARRLRDCP